MTTVQKLEEASEGVWTAIYNVKRYRFLLEDGRTIDVDAVWSDANLSTAILSHFKSNRIVGHTEIVPPKAAEEPPKVVKKAPAAKKTAAKR